MSRGQQIRHWPRNLAVTRRGYVPFDPPLFRYDLPAVQTSANIFTKTDAGIRELIERSLRLPALQRRALILIDGKRHATELAILLCVQKVEDILDPLVQADLIRSNNSQTAVASKAPRPVKLDTRALESARLLMQQSTSHHLGVLGAALQDRIRSAGSREDLTSVCARWHMEMRASKKGRDQADALLTTLHELLQAA